MDILVMASDKTLWALGPFSYLFNKYWSPTQTVIVAGFKEPDFELPANFRFLSIGKQEDFPASRWTDAFRIALDRLYYRHAVVMLEDYWLCRKVDLPAVELLLDYCHKTSDVLRMDLTTDRLYSNHIQDLGPLDRLDLIESYSDSDYQISLQAGLWNVEHLKSILESGWSPWDFEVAGSTKIRKLNLRVLGTRQAPVRYLIAIRGGKFSMDGSWQYPPKQLLDSDIEELRRLGYLEGAKA